MKVIQNSFDRGFFDRHLENRIETGITQKGFIDGLNVFVNNFGTLSRRPCTHFFSNILSADITKGGVNLGPFLLRIRNDKFVLSVVTADNPEIDQYKPIFNIFGTSYAEGEPTTFDINWSVDNTTFLPTGDNISFSYQTNIDTGIAADQPYFSSNKHWIGHTGIGPALFLDRTFITNDGTAGGASIDESLIWNPDASCFFQDRFWIIIDNVLRASKVGIYTDFRGWADNTETDGLQYTLTRFNGKKCRWMISNGTASGDVLVLGFDDCEVIMTPPTVFHATATAPAAAPQFVKISNTGSSSARVCLVSNGFVHENRNQLFIKTQQSIYNGWERDVLNDLFDFPSNIIDFCVQTDPFDILWVLLNDGTLWSLTINNNLKIKAWCKHSIGLGTIRGIAMNPGSSSAPTTDKTISAPNTSHNSFKPPNIYTNPKQVLYLLIQLPGSRTTPFVVLWLDIEEADDDAVIAGHTANQPYFNNIFLDCLGYVNDPSQVDTNFFNGGIGIDGLGNSNPITNGVTPTWTLADSNYGPWVIGFPYQSYVTFPRPIFQTQQGSSLGTKTNITKITVEVPRGSPDSINYIQQNSFDIGYEITGSYPANRFNGWIQDRPLSDAESQGLITREAKGEIYDRNIKITAVDQWRMDINSIIIEVENS